MTRTRASLVCAVLMLAAACGMPIRVRHLNGVETERQLTRNVLTTGDLSRRTRNLLYEHDLVARYDKDPAGALAALHAKLVADTLRPESVVALAELAFHHANAGGGSPYYLAAAVYAWAYLFPDDPSDVADRTNPRVRVACDLYNRGLTEGLKRGQRIDIQAGTYPLPFGALDVTVDSATLQWGSHPLHDFVPIAEYTVEGFPTYYRWPGLGAPLAAAIAPVEGTGFEMLAPRARVPVTAVLQLSDLSPQLRAGRLQGTLELRPGYGAHTMEMGGRIVPLESEPTATLGFALTETGIWERETSGFLRGAGVISERARLVSLRPYEPGLIPVVFVHGTASSAARWAPLFNELDNDPRIHARYQFWAFSYETGNPIIYSAMLLRESLKRAVAGLDPDGHDEALRHMVVIGHSQGGLVTKAMVVESGDAFWQNVSQRPFDEMRFSEQTRDLFLRALFFHPLPFVKRVVFVATPHHGSYIAGNWLAHQVAKLISAPLDITRAVGDLVVNQDALTANAFRGAPTAVDNMTPNNPFVKKLLSLPIADDVAANSIIPVLNPGPPQGQKDGVVEYDSAHIDGVESELVVRSGHSCQDNPYTIEEVRRILLEHVKTP